LRSRWHRIREEHFKRESSIKNRKRQVQEAVKMDGFYSHTRSLSLGGRESKTSTALS